MYHSTIGKFIGKILDDKALLNSNVIKNKERSSGKYIYFTPVTKDFIENYPHKNAIILDFDKTISKYDKFFINTSNAFGPMSGLGDNKECTTCSYTYRSPNFPRNNSDKRNCVLETLEDILDKVVSFPQNEQIYDDCDGGPEIGFLTDRIILDDDILIEAFVNGKTQQNGGFIKRLKKQDVKPKKNQKKLKKNPNKKYLEKITKKQNVKNKLLFKYFQKIEILEIYR